MLRPTHDYLYATFGFNPTIGIFSIRLNGALSPIGKHSIYDVDYIFSISAHQHKPLLYVLCARGKSRHIITLSAQPNGQLVEEEAPHKPPELPRMNVDPEAEELAVDPQNRFLFVATSSLTIYVFHLHPNGKIGQCISSSRSHYGYSNGMSPSLTFSHDGQVLFVSAGGHFFEEQFSSLQVYKIKPNGYLSQRESGNLSWSDVVLESTIPAFDARVIYVPIAGEFKIRRYAYTQAGDVEELPSLTFPTTVPGGRGNWNMGNGLMDPTGRFVYIGSDSGDLLQFRVAAGLTLAPLRPFTSPTSEGYNLSLVTDKSGTFLYAACNVGNASIFQYRIQPNGQLSQTGKPIPLPTDGCSSLSLVRIP